MHGLTAQSSCVSSHAAVLCQGNRQLLPSEEQHLQSQVVYQVADETAHAIIALQARQ